jgi:hypothetical protein
MMNRVTDKIRVNRFSDLGQCEGDRLQDAAHDGRRYIAQRKRILEIV